MARGAWQQTALLASLSAFPEEGAGPFTPADFNPFLASQRSDRGSTQIPYDPAVLQNLQDSNR
ncbi:hypothetical protein LCGC14_2058500 [marine sediment metagenome]|uniref:Uncharacterized protein n=1 Tax=marine sediment metagenome TaxID=412755 RepID=A0A0F9ELS2_9ZZZZ